MNQDTPNWLVVFDCDGTLVDSQHAIVKAMKSAFRHYALSEPSAEATRRTVGLPLGEAIRCLLPAGAQDKLDDVAAQYKEAVSILRQKPEHEEPLYPGVAQVRNRLRHAVLQLVFDRGGAHHLEVVLHGVGGGLERGLAARRGHARGLVPDKKKEKITEITRVA